MSDSTYEIKLTLKARNDIESIYSYISEGLHNPSAAQKLADKFDKAFDKISTFPLSCPIGKTEKEYRKLIVENYIAFYKVIEETKTLIVYRVFYGMMDYNKYLWYNIINLTPQ